MAKKQIIQPVQGSTVGRYFVAHGTSKRRESLWIKGKLTRINADKKEVLVSEGKTILQPHGKNGLWAILFENVAVFDGLRLVVSDKKMEWDISPTFNVVIPDKDTFRGIIHPGDGTTVCGQFAAYGTTPNTSATVSGTMMNTTMVGENHFQGTTVLQPTSQGLWGVLFSNVPDSIDAGGVVHKYTLDVVDSSGSDFTSSDITVDHNTCN